MDLLIENVRSFSGSYSIPVKPLTLLTGENSSGKSTFLALLAAAVDSLNFPLRPRLNDPPYSLGNYDTIATYKGGRYGRASSFSIGLRDPGVINPRNRNHAEIFATYVTNQGRAEVSSVRGKNAALEATITFRSGEKAIVVDWVITEDGKKSAFTSEMEHTIWRNVRFSLTDLIFTSMMSTEIPRSKDSSMMDKILDLFSINFSSRSLHTVSIAPIRTKPKRTYDQINEEFTPEGEHVPFILSEILDNDETREKFEQFGIQSGLYKKIAVKKLGDTVGSPVQLMVTNEGRSTNLLDVGYGVSQALPVIVESLLAAPQSLLLLQQPEVHLHPRAQAALGSLFVNLHKTQRKNFVIETHSDYIIDRIRQEVAKGEIKASDVGVLYFEKHGNETNVYPLSLDKDGNILNAPPSYREFFLLEELSLLSRTGL